MIQSGTFILEVNQRIKMRTGWVRCEELIYAGMLDQNTLSLVITWSYAHNSMAYNLFVSTRQKEIDHKYLTILIRRVTPTNIELELRPKR